MTTLSHHSILFATSNSYFCEYSGKAASPYQIATNNNESQRFTIFLKYNNPLQYAHIYGILRLVQVAKEMSRDHDGRRNLLHARRDSQITENGRGLSNATLTPEENTCLQNQWAVAYRSRRVQGIHGKEQEHSRRQIKKAGSYQLINNNSAAQVVAYKFPRLPATTLSSPRRLLRILPYVVRCCQPLYNIWMSCKGGGWRADHD